MRVREDRDYLLNSEPREFKMGLIDTLTNMESNLQMFNESSPGGMQDEQKTRLEGLSVQSLEKVSRKCFVRVTKLLLVTLREKLGLEQCAQIVNQRDKKGLSLLHYCLALDYFEIIGVLARCGCDLNLVTSKTEIPAAEICTMLDH